MEVTMNDNAETSRAGRLIGLAIGIAAPLFGFACLLGFLK
jgi:hypothetical protein